MEERMLVPSGALPRWMGRVFILMGRGTMASVGLSVSCLLTSFNRYLGQTQGMGLRIGMLWSLGLVGRGLSRSVGEILVYAIK